MPALESRIFFARSGVLALLLSSAFCVIASPHQADTSRSVLSRHSIATLQKASGIPRFAEVTPNLYRGGDPNQKDMETLKRNGINIVVNMRGGRHSREEARARKLGMRYVSIPWHCPLPQDEPFARFLKLVEENPTKKIFVHCRLGDDRTGMAVAAYRMAEEGWSAEEAMKEMRAFGFTRAHHLICPTLAQYERSFPHRLKTSPAFKDLHQRRTGIESK
jgi:protein tyrosine phosphatase (PTP) superfamily phosphohydrolase (DUF442 family)